jgi:hypothetical protein
VEFKRSETLSNVFSLSETEATSGIGTPLTEFAIGAGMLLILVFFHTADKSVRFYLKPYPIFIDKLLLGLCHS